MKIIPIAKSIIVLIGFFLLLSVSPPDIYSSKFNSSGDAFFWQVVGVSNAHAGKMKR